MPDAQTTVSDECQRCGASVELHDVFCRQCGGNLGAEATGRSRGALLSWGFYLLVMLGTAAAVYAFLEARGPAGPADRQQPESRGAPVTVAPADGGDARAPVSPPPPRIHKDPPSGAPTRGAPRQRAAGTSAAKGGAPIDAAAPKGKRRVQAAPMDAGTKQRGREAAHRQTPDAGQKLKIDAGLSPREAARARVNAGVIGYVVNHNRVRLRRCLERLTKKGLEPSGLVEIHLSVGAEGRALRSKVHTNTTAFPSLGRCIANEMARWRYPRPAGGSAELIYPFRFSSGK